MPVNNTIQLRKGLSSEWASTNPVLASGEPGYDLTNSILKIGDGTNPWSDLPSTASSEIYVYAKNTTTGTLYKGQAVYINGALGANPTIALAIASGEATSSKTLGLLKQNLAVNEFGYVISEGILDSVDTDGALSAGDPIWLSATTPGGVVYGLANKPYAPNHMVFLGYVLRKQLNNGKIYVKVQNGYELEELHNVATTGVTNGQFLQYNSSSGLWVASSSGNFTTLQVNNTGVSVSGHTHTSSQITDFNNSVSGLLSVTNIVAGTGISVSSNSGSYTINLSASTITGYEILTATKDTFTVSPNYLIGNLSVYYNGFKLLNGEDYTATNGSTFTLSSPGASGDVVEWLALGGAAQYAQLNHTHVISDITNFGSGVSGLLSKTIAVFTASDNQPPASGFATLDTRNSILVLEFDAASDESAVFVGYIPDGAILTNGLKTRISWAADTATSGNVRWGAQFEADGTDLDSDSFDTASLVTSAANATNGIETIAEITSTSIDSLIAGDRFRLKIYRDADDATNDTMSGDAQLISVEVRAT